MQQLTFIKRGVLQWQEVAEPVIREPTEALVRPLAVARCDLDVGVLYGLAPFRGPFPFGHEFIAEVVAVGEAVKGFRPGDRVIVPFQISCGHCRRCRKGISASCLSVSGLAMYGLGRDARAWGGAFSDLVWVPFAERMLLPLPAGIEPAAVASISDNLADAWRTVGPMLAAEPGATVLVVGGGAWSIGVYAAAMAVALGASQVDYLDNGRERLELAAAAGANPLEGTPGEPPGKYAITVDASATPEGLTCAIRATEPYGVCTSVGIYWRDVPLPLIQMYNEGITFKTGRVNSREVIPQVLELVQSGRFQPEKYTTRLASWGEAAEALMEQTTKVVVSR
jgi:threonine dehydrogenase-like Zn-dependent dehydrogenase